VQSFCFRQIEDVVIRKELPLPILTLEADAPGKLDKKARMRIEAFIQMLKERKDEKRWKKSRSDKTL
jgi:benzoyl-CoA reductase/2-hydroxyglutaryl-CoA dehydratase subunit BcrC/BadD/HgdB